MKTDKKTLLLSRLKAAARWARKHAPLLFVVFLVAVYGFLLWQARTYIQAEPSQTDIQAQLKTIQVPHIDKSVLAKIQQLQNNSVSVHALFDQARSNPFQE